jgi:DNA-binding SARP family transcriptional activator
VGVLQVSLFGRFRVRCGRQPLAGLGASKVQELFCYLLLYRDRPHPREALANLLWGDCPTIQSKRYLRKALWRIQTALDSRADSNNGRVLLVEPDWVRFNPEADLWLDVAAFEQAYTLAQGIPGRDLDSQRVQLLREAVDLYQGDLLEGWYHDWCLYERERLQHVYLAMLDKLMDTCEADRDYEAGLTYGARILRYDRARERTHRRLMRLHYLSKSRTAALRQYERCVAALNEELHVGPARRTVALYEQIRADQLIWPPLALAEAHALSETVPPSLSHILARLRQLHDVLADIQHRVRQDIEAMELALRGKR